MKNLSAVAVILLALGPIAQAATMTYESCESDDVCLALPSEAPESVAVLKADAAEDRSMLTNEDLPGRSGRSSANAFAQSSEPGVPLALSQGMAIQNQLRQLDNFLYVLPYRSISKGNPTVSISGVKR